MREKDFQNLLESIKQAGEYMKGKRKPSRVFRTTPANEIILDKTQKNSGKKVKKWLKSNPKSKRT